MSLLTIQSGISHHEVITTCWLNSNKPRNISSWSRYGPGLGNLWPRSRVSLCRTDIRIDKTKRKWIIVKKYYFTLWIFVLLETLLFIWVHQTTRCHWITTSKIAESSQFERLIIFWNNSINIGNLEPTSPWPNFVFQTCIKW